MKYLTDKKSIAVIFAVCMLIALCAGIILANTADNNAYADTAEDNVLIASWERKEVTITFDTQGGNAGFSIYATVGEPMPPTAQPGKLGYEFLGYYTEPNGAGTKYYNEDMSSAHICDFETDATLYAKWSIITYTITYVGVEARYNPNPTTYTIEDVRDNPLVFAEPTNCGQTLACDWDPQQISVDFLSNMIVTGTYRARRLWENKIVENGDTKYYIYSESQFLDLNDEAVEMNSNVYFYLEADLDFFGHVNPCISRWFKGYFYGQNHSISGVKIVYNTNYPAYYGLFHFNFLDSIICDINLYGAMHISGNANCSAGLLCGMNLGTINNCNVYGESRYGNEQSYDILCENQGTVIGGIVGTSDSQGTVSRCVNNASIYSCSTTGGIAGEIYMSKLFSNNTNNGDIYIFNIDHPHVGGLIGSLQEDCISSCYNNGNIYLLTDENIESNLCVGYYIGYVRHMEYIMDCVNTGKAYIETPNNFVEYSIDDIGNN